jgi:ABC-type antimicrobial peptide transport system permease subunit
MAEEVHNPTHQLPRALAWSPMIGLVCGLMYLLPIMVTLPDIATLLAGMFRMLIFDFR